jgi:hypothetical protein
MFDDASISCSQAVDLGGVTGRRQSSWEWRRSSRRRPSGDTESLATAHGGRRLVPFSRSPSLVSALPRLSCVVAHWSGTRSRVISWSVSLQASTASSRRSVPFSRSPSLVTARWSMRILGPIVQISALSVLDAGKQLTPSDTIAPQLVGHDQDAASLLARIASEPGKMGASP